MIVPGPATRIFLAPGPTDLRRSFVKRQLPFPSTTTKIP